MILHISLLNGSMMLHLLSISSNYRIMSFPNKNRIKKIDFHVGRLQATMKHMDILVRLKFQGRKMIIRNRYVTDILEILSESERRRNTLVFLSLERVGIIVEDNLWWEWILSRKRALTKQPILQNPNTYVVWLNDEEKNEKPCRYDWRIKMIEMLA